MFFRLFLLYCETPSTNFGSATGSNINQLIFNYFLNWDGFITLQENKVLPMQQTIEENSYCVDQSIADIDSWI